MMFNTHTILTFVGCFCQYKLIKLNELSTESDDPISVDSENASFSRVMLRLRLIGCFSSDILTEAFAFVIYEVGFIVHVPLPSLAHYFHFKKPKY